METFARIGRFTLTCLMGATLVAGSLTFLGCSPVDDETETVNLDVYFISAGENAIAVMREVSVAADAELVAVAMEQLLAGLTEQEIETQPGLSTGIPENTELLEATVDGDVATVDLSAEFEEGASTAMQINSRVAQVVYTVTAVDGVDSVLFLIEGESVDMFGDHGLDLTEPQTAEMYESAVPIDA